VTPDEHAALASGQSHGGYCGCLATIAHALLAIDGRLAQIVALLSDREGRS
jgi:hypothetical protein